jgi:hypothetical protein
MSRFSHHYEYYNFLLDVLERRRMKILQRGPLSEEEDYRLTEIDAEMAMYSRFLVQLDSLA